MIAPALTVVIASAGRAEAAAAARSVAASAGAAGIRAQIVVVWQGAGSPPEAAEAELLCVLPLGLSYARNRGLAEARAPLVAFVDDDEVADPGWAAALLDAFDRHPAAGAVFGAILPLDRHGFPHCRVGGERERVFAGKAVRPTTVGSGGNMAFRRPVLTTAGGFDHTLGAGSPGRSGEEADAILRLLAAGTPIVSAPRVVVYHPTKTARELLACRYPYGYGMGRVIRRHRAAGLLLRYGKDAAAALAAAAVAGDGLRARGAAAYAAGLAAGLAAGPASRPDSRLLDHLPAELRHRIAGLPVRPLRSSCNGGLAFTFRVGRHRLLRVHVDAAPPLRRSVFPGQGIPSPGRKDGCRPEGAGESRGSLWVLERLPPGSTPLRHGLHRLVPAGLGRAVCAAAARLARAPQRAMCS